MEQTKKKQLILSVIGVIVLLIIVGGISYAMYTFIGTGSKENVITSGAVSIDYAEQTNITLTNEYPKSDTLGINSTEPNSTMQFTVSANITGKQTINYAIGFDSITEGTTLTDSYVKVYLTKGTQTATNFELNTGRTINSFRTSYIDGIMDSYAILTDSFNQTTSHTYTLKAWVADNYKLPTTDTSNNNIHGNTTTSETFKFKIKVVATDGAVTIKTDTETPVITTANIYLVNDNVSYKEQETKTLLLANSNREPITNQALNTNDKIEVELVYSKTLRGEAPTLELKFGSNTAVGTISKGVITNNKITYSYTIQTNDRGTIKLDRVVGDKLTDIRGNKAEPTIKEEINNSLKDITTILPNLDASGANVPDLATGMIPVYYDATNDTWRKADSENKQLAYRWYSYESTGSNKGMWANAVTVSKETRTTYMNAPLGTTISMDDIYTMWVWIPRFTVNIGGLSTQEYFNSIRGEATSGYYLNPGAININFVDINTPALDAFWWDNDSDSVEDTGEQKSGFWFAKFEISGVVWMSGDNIRIKPNAGIHVQLEITVYNRNILQMGIDTFGFTGITHMIKNNEWGAVAYLTQSIYGRCTSSTSCTEVAANGSYTAGSSAYTTNINQTTTGTIYGIYDMNGGASEYVMGNYNNKTGDSGFGNYMPSGKYYNKYTSSSYTGHALTETLGWYGDAANFVSSSYPWFVRGANGIFSFDRYYGSSRNDIATRIAIVK